RGERGREREARRPRQGGLAEPMGDRELPRAEDRVAPDRPVGWARGMADRSFSHAIAEGDGISVIAAVEDPDAARAAESQRAEALVVRGDPSSFRDATALPILWRA